MAQAMLHTQSLQPTPPFPCRIDLEPRLRDLETLPAKQVGVKLPDGRCRQWRLDPASVQAAYQPGVVTRMLALIQSRGSAMLKQLTSTATDCGISIDACAAAMLGD